MLRAIGALFFVLCLGVVLRHWESAENVCKDRGIKCFIEAVWNGK